MQLSENTFGILKNFSGINPNLVFKQGNQLKTISVAKNILATATITETIPQEFGIYDLNEFLSVVGMFDTPNLEFMNSSTMKVRDTSGTQSINYFFSDVTNLTAPSKDITMPVCEIEFDLSEVQLNALRKAAATLGVSDVVVSKNDAGEVAMKVTDTKNPTSNSFELELGTAANAVVNASDFQMVFTIGNFKFASGDYRVKLSSKLISHFKNKKTPIEYWVALEKSSTFTA
jgi:hypothetical protein|tara:strand:+ start:8337 stop:9029 length:693 start_codon:yes stop_codon:yes gene_type:complete